MNSLQTAVVIVSLNLINGCTPGRPNEASYRPLSSTRVTEYELAQCRPSATLLEAVEDLRPSFLGTSCRTDSDRPLTPLGESVAALMGRTIADRGSAPELIVSSAALSFNASAAPVRLIAGSTLWR